MAWKLSATLGVWVALLACWTVVASAAPVHAPASPAAANDPVFTSNNWAGYADTIAPHSAINVTAEWIEPTPNCASTHPATVASIWTGFDGYPSTNPTVEGIGSVVICFYGLPLYHAFFEIFPAAPVVVALAINGGDAMFASVSVVGNNLSLFLKDLTTLGSFGATVPISSAWAMSSVECVVQRDHRSPVNLASPVHPAGILGPQFQFTNFGTIVFRECTVTYPGALPMGIANLPPPAVVYQIAVTRVGTTIFATTSVAAGAVSTFNVTWHHY